MLDTIYVELNFHQLNTISSHLSVRIMTLKKMIKETDNRELRTMHQKEMIETHCLNNKIRAHRDGLLNGRK